jgi:hypothetical protein
MKRAVFEAIAHSRVGKTWKHSQTPDESLFVVLSVIDVVRSVSWEAGYIVLNLDGASPGMVWRTFERSWQLWATPESRIELVE